MFPEDFVKKLRSLDYTEVGNKKDKTIENEDAPKAIYWVLPYHPNIKEMRLDRVANEVLKSYGEENHYKVSIAWSKKYQALGDEMRALVQ